MVYRRAELRDRIKAGIGTAVLEAFLAFALIAGLRVKLAPQASADIKVFNVLPPKPAALEKMVPPSTPAKAPEGAASPRNIKTRATPVVAPPPPVPLPVPPTVTSAPVAASGFDRTTGASDVIGPGTGAGGWGNGTGAGGRGNGSGGGGGRGTGPRLIKGRIKDSDYPREAGRAGIGGTVTVRYTVGLDGRASECTIMRSSGNEEIDDATCRLIEKRFRYEPARDAEGRPIRSRVEDSHEWVIDNQPPEQDQADYPEQDQRDY